MRQQLIVTILGTDKLGILSTIAQAVGDCHCNILDSRQAVYGQDFSLTMILEGTHNSITRAEACLPHVCHQHDLLSLMKRTAKHCKQNLEHVVDVEFSGKDNFGVIKNITAFFVDHQIDISAFRQKTFEQSNEEHMKCKMVVSIPDTIDMKQIETEFQALLSNLSLQGKIIENH